MKNLMFALAAALPLFATADTNTVSRAEFDDFKERVNKRLLVLECFAEMSDGAKYGVAQKLVNNFDELQNKLSSENSKQTKRVTREELRSRLEKKGKLRGREAATKNAATNAPTLLRK